MSQRKHEHPLRTIVLEYDDAKPETDYEKKLISDFLLLCDKAVVLKQQGSKLLYEYQQLDDRVTDAEKALVPLSEAAPSFLKEATVLTQKVKDKESISNIYERMFELQEQVINPFHNEVLSPVADSLTALDEEYEAHEEACEKFWEEFEAFDDDSIEIFKNYDNYSLDIVTLDDELEAFKEAMEHVDFNDDRNKIIDHYDLFIEAVNKAYDEIKETQRLLSNFYDDKGLLDKSLSDGVADGSIPKEQSPLYLMPPDDKRVESFPLSYGMLASSDKHTLTISVPQDVVRMGDTAMIQELIMQLQHFPKMIEKWIFAIDISITKHDDIAMEEDEWKGHAVPMKWFNKLNSLLCAIFFIQDSDARAYMLLGDLVADGILKPTQEGEAVIADGEAMQEIQGRLFQCCWFFMLYCHNTGFDPQPYIEALMAEFEAAFTFEDVKKKYDEDIAAGIQLRTVTKQNEEPEEEGEWEEDE